MPFPNGTYINQILDPNVKNELDQFYSLLQGYLSNQHHDDGSHGAVTADSLTVNGAVTVTGAFTETSGTPATFSSDIVANKGVNDAAAFPQEVSLRQSGTAAGNSQTAGPGLSLGPTGVEWAWGVVANEAKITGGTGRRQLVFLRRGVGGPDKGILALSTDDSNTANVYYLYPPSGSSATVHIGSPAGAQSDAAAVGNVYCAEVFEAARSTGMGYWQNFSPTLANITVGNGTVVARYTLVGKTVHVYVSFTLGSTSAIGTGPQVSLPVTGNSNIVDVAIGNGEAIHTGVAGYSIIARAGSTTGLLPLVQNLTGGYVSEAQITATVPFTWVTGDMLNLSFTYEMA